MTIRLRAVCFALILLPMGLASGDPVQSPESKPKVTERRRHFEIMAKDGTRLYEGTEIIRLSDLTDENHVLVRDENHGDFVMRRVWNFRTQILQQRIADVKDRGFIQLTYKMPFTSRTRLETLEEARSQPALVQQVVPLYTLETNGGTWEGSESEWDKDPTTLRSLRHSVRATLDRFILEAIERGRGLLFATVEAEPFFSVVGRYAVYDTEDAEEADDAHLMETRAAAPNCEFDEAFGYPCSEKQRERIKKAAKDGVVPEAY